MDHYKTLNVARDATAAEIKKNYRKLANRHHPDKNSGDDTEFKKIGEAYDILSDADKRKNYDLYPNGNPFDHAGRGGGEFNFEDLFSRARAQAPINPDSLANIQVTLKQAFEGADFNIDLAGGTINLKIPTGTRSGTRMRIPGKAPKRYPDLPPGDLIAVVNIAMPPNWGWHGDDLYYQTKVDAISAMIGGSGEVDHVSGKKYKVAIPAGTQHNDKIRLKGLGMTNPVNTIVGNLFIVIDIYVPTITNKDDNIALTKIRESIVNGK